MKIEPIKDKIAIVTGASRGIGKAIAKALHQAHAKVVITGRDKNTLNQAKEEIGNQCYAITCDQSIPDEIDAFHDEVINTVGPPDILINNAAKLNSQPVMDMPLTLFEDVIKTNLTGVFYMTKRFLPYMIQKNRGDVIMISSMSGKKGDPGSSAYASSKFGLQGFSQSLMYEVRKHNIRVMVINPSRVNTQSDDGKLYGKGLTLHMDDIASTLLHLLTLPGRTTIRDMDIWGTNP